MSIEREELSNFLDKSLVLLQNAEEFAFEKFFKDKVSINEVHLIKKIGDGEKIGKNTASDIAKSMGVTLGTLTVTTKTLTKKGLIDRIKADLDKRIVRLTLKPLGYDIYIKNEAFRKKMSMDILKNLNKKEQTTLINAMHIIEKHFY